MNVLGAADRGADRTGTASGNGPARNLLFAAVSGRPSLLSADGSTSDRRIRAHPATHPRRARGPKDNPCHRTLTPAAQASAPPRHPCHALRRLTCWPCVIRRIWKPDVRKVGTPSRSAVIFFGLLVHQTIEEIHRIVMDGKVATLDEARIKDLF